MTQATPAAAPMALLDALLERYWDCAFKEGQEGRTHDTEDGAAQRTLTDIRTLVQSLLTAGAARPTYRVFVRPMEESHRVTYWTTILSSSRPADAKIWDRAGVINPSMSEDLWKAEHEAESWAEFLGTTAEPYVQPEWVREALVRISQRGDSEGADEEGAPQ